MPQTCSKLSILPACCKLSNLSISSSCDKCVKIRLVATYHLQTCYNLLKQLAASLWITNFDNQRAATLLTTCNRVVINKAWDSLLTISLSQVVNRLVAS